MRRPSRIQLATLLSAFATAQASAQSVRSDAVRPAVMLLVDTSGSMERLPDDGTNPDCESCVPTCTGNSATDAANKTRWALTVEALTGTMTGYKCEVQDRSNSPYQPSWYDYGYYLPHVDFTKDLAQESDGILDAFRNRVKFGLMTFDGVGTTIGGATLVPYSDWLGSNNPAFMERANGAPGMYSYGRIGRLSFPGCPTDYGINAGARGPGDHDGALIRVGKSDNLDDVTAVNDRIQASLLKVRPFGGTPIAAMLDDLKYYIDGSDVDSDLSKTGDPFYSCRDRTAILITDGAPDALFRDKRFNCDAPDSVVPSCAPNSDPAADSTSTKCECPYKPAELIAQELVDGIQGKALLKQLIVVAYNVYDEQALTTLNEIGRKGMNDIELNPGADYPYIIEAKGQAELREALNRLLTASSEVVSSRSVPISVNTGDALLGDNSRRYDITAGYFRPKNADDPWSGLLYRQRVLCESAAGGAVAQTMRASEGDIIHDRLNQRTTPRDLFTVKPGAATLAGGTLLNDQYNPSNSPVQLETDTSAFSSSAPAELLDLTGVRDTSSVQNHLKPDGTDFPRTSPLALDDTIVTNHQLVDVAVRRVAFDTALDSSFFGDADNDRVPGEAEDRDLVVNYVSGRSRPGNVMADIFHSNPTAMVPVNSASGSRLNNINATYSTWLGALASNASGSHYREGGRPGMIFVGTNDGVLHAFNLESWRDPGGGSHEGGDELWAFTPPALFGKMASMLSGHQFMFDGTPIVRDVVLQKQPSKPPMFRTILVSAVRGAPAYVALDVTFPESPEFLWQTSFGAMGNTIANPGLTQVDLTWMDERQTRAVAILPGGEGVQSSSCSGGQPLERGVTRAQFPVDNTRNVRCWQQRGRSLYVVDVATGRLIQEFGPEHFPSPLTGSVVVDGLGTASSSAAYFFDHDGVLWRLSMLSTDPSKWRVQPLYDMFADPFDTTGSTGERPDWAAGRRPTYAPTLTYDRLGNLVILAGTGDLDSPMDTAYQRVISLTEYRDAGLGDTEIAGTVELNWKIDLLANEAVSGPLTVLNGVTYFATFQSMADASDQCALGVSRIYGAHAFERKPASGAPKDWPPEPRPELVRTGNLPTDPRVLSEEYDNGGSNQLIGLTITREPICVASGGTVRNPVLGQDMQKGMTTGGGYGITAMLSGDSDRAQPTNGSKLSQMGTQHLPDQRRQAISTWASYAE